jgi:hypothetical protein
MGRFDSVDIRVRNPESGSVLLATRVPSDGDGVLLAGQIHEGAESLDARIELPKNPELERVLADALGPLRDELQRGEVRHGDLHFRDQDGSRVDGFGLVFERVSIGEFDSEHWMGVYTTPRGRFEFSAASDPEPIIIITGIAAAVCLIQKGIFALRSGCEARLHETALECMRTGGSPRYRVHANFGLSFSPFKIGCDPTCEFLGCDLRK